MRSKSFYKIIVFTSFSVLMVLIANAQPGDPSADPDVPITGIEVLLAIGGILGIRKFLTGKKNPR